MNATQVRQAEGFISLLASSGRSPEIPESDDVYGWLVGSWELEVLHYKAVDVSSRHIQGEAHFGWALEGRAVQDVWIMPRCSVRHPDLDKTNNMYGTTLRVWDATIQAWRINWINPVTGHREQQIGRRMAKTSCKWVRVQTAPPRAGDLRRSPRTRSTGSARHSSRMGTRGSLKASFSRGAFVSTVLQIHLGRFI